jgi:hypothetical protein
MEIRLHRAYGSKRHRFCKRLISEMGFAVLPRGALSVTDASIRSMRRHDENYL